MSAAARRPPDDPPEEGCQGLVSGPQNADTAGTGIPFTPAMQALSNTPAYDQLARSDKVVNFLDDARALGLKVQAPDVNASDYMFKALDARTIRYGLGAVKGVGRGACDAIAQSCARDGVFRDFLPRKSCCACRWICWSPRLAV